MAFQNSSSALPPVVRERARRHARGTLSREHEGEAPGVPGGDIGTFTGQVTLYVLPTHHIASTAALDQQFSTRTIPSLGLTIMLEAGALRRRR